jgi:hypothetical protein
VAGEPGGGAEDDGGAEHFVQPGVSAKTRQPKAAAQSSPTNFTGCVAEVSASFKACVMQDCARPPSAPAATKPAHCSALGALQPGIASGSVKAVTNTACQNTITSLRSCRVSALVIRMEHAKSGAEAARIANQSALAPPSPGAMTMPMPPSETAAAAQRAGRIGSERKSTAPSMTKTGAEKLTAVTSASGTCGSAVNQVASAAVWTRPRHTCPRRLCGRQAARPWRHSSGSSTARPNR